MLPAIFPEFNPRYPLPVRDNVDFVNQLDDEAATDSELFKECPEILQDFADIIGGEYKVQRKTVFFKPKKAGSPKLSLVESSSAVRSLLDIGFYLRHRARKGDLLMIDEPELNLHPANQRRVARLLARLVNWGVRVFVTTHSDYIAKELNTLLLLSRLDAVAIKKHGYRPEEALRSEQVRLHIAHLKLVRRSQSAKRSSPQNVIEPVPPLEDGGFAYSSFDDTIEHMNHVQREVWDEVSAKEEP